MEGSNGSRRLARGCRALTRCATLVACAVAAASCGSGDGYGTGGGGGTLTPTFTSIQANVFTPICVTCHSGASAPHGLRLDGGNSYALLVGVPSDEQPSILRVKPNDPNTSYLVQKIQGTAASGERMPAGMPALPQATIDTIRQWITNGATNDAQTSSAAIRVSSMSPLPGSTVTTLPASITVAFDREVNATTVDTTTFRLERSGGDGVFGNGNDVAITPASVTVPAANTHSAVMSLAGVAARRTTPIGSRCRGLARRRSWTCRATRSMASTAARCRRATARPAATSSRRSRSEPCKRRCSRSRTTSSRRFAASCHTGVGASLPGSMNLSNVTASRAALVSVASVEKPGVQRVAPSNSAGSYIVQKLQGDPGIGGNRMPLGGPYLDQPTINVIRQWIDAGAP